MGNVFAGLPQDFPPDGEIRAREQDIRREQRGREENGLAEQRIDGEHAARVCERLFENDARDEQDGGDDDGDRLAPVFPPHALRLALALLRDAHVLEGVRLPDRGGKRRLALVFKGQALPHEVDGGMGHAVERGDFLFQSARAVGAVQIFEL